MKNKAHKIKYQLATHRIIDLNDLSDFVKLNFPFRTQIVESLIKLLPSVNRELFQLHEHQLLQKKIFKKVENNLGIELKLINRPVANFAPKYAEFKIFIPDFVNEKDLAYHVYGFGQSFFSESEAFDKALGEFIERYLLSFDWKTETIIATKNQLGSQAVSITGTATYLASQTKGTELLTNQNKNQVKLGWVRARKLFGWKKKYVPAQRVFWMYRQKSDEASLNHPTSNGGAGAFSKRCAELSGLYELVERDSFMFHWLLKVTPRYIDESTIDTPGYTASRHLLKRYQSEVYFLDISITDIPAVLCVMVDRSITDEPKFSFGAAAGFDKNKLIDGSYMEALVVQRHHWFTDNNNAVTFQDKCFFEDLYFDGQDLNNRIRFWTGKEAEKHLGFLFSGEGVSYGQFVNQYIEGKPVNNLTQEYFHVKTIFKNLTAQYGEAYEPFVFFVKHKLLNMLGYFVCNVVVMGFYPLYLVEHKVNQDILKIEHWKLAAKKRKLNWDGKVKNYHPHPFP